MPQIIVAITHQTLSLEVELKLLAQQKVAIGTSIVDRTDLDLNGRERVDTELMDQLGREGGLAIVTYGKENPRWLCRVSPRTPVMLFEGLRSLQMAAMVELPQGLRHINTMGSTIRPLSDNERVLVMAEADRVGLSSSGRG